MSLVDTLTWWLVWVGCSVVILFAVIGFVAVVNWATKGTFDDPRN